MHGCHIQCVMGASERIKFWHKHKCSNSSDDGKFRFFLLLLLLHHPFCNWKIVGSRAQEGGGGSMHNFCKYLNIPTKKALTGFGKKCPKQFKRPMGSNPFIWFAKKSAKSISFIKNHPNPHIAPLLIQNRIDWLQLIGVDWWLTFSKAADCKQKPQKRLFPVCLFFLPIDWRLILLLLLWPAAWGANHFDGPTVRQPVEGKGTPINCICPNAQTLAENLACRQFIIGPSIYLSVPSIFLPLFFHTQLLSLAHNSRSTPQQQQ